MFTQITPNNPVIGIMPILNGNRISDEKRREAIKAMGMSACQGRCLSCNCCAHCSGKTH